MTAQQYEQLICEGIKGLSLDALAEIMDFVCFVRQRWLEPHVLADEQQELLIRADLKKLSREEDEHLAKEFEGYEQRYPAE